MGYKFGTCSYSVICLRVHSILCHIVILSPSYMLVMNSTNTCEWKVLCWNVRGLNSDWKWDSIRDKIAASACDVICFQDTKNESFDLNFIKKLCPPSYDSFCYLPLVGVSGGIITIWKSCLLDGQLAYQSNYAVAVSFTSRFSNEEWLLTNIYGPSAHEGKRDFLD